MSGIDNIFDPDRIRHRFEDLQGFRKADEKTPVPRLTILDHLDAFRVESKPYLEQSNGLRLLFDEASRLIRRLLSLDPRLPNASFSTIDAGEEQAIEQAVSEAIAMPGGTPAEDCSHDQLLLMLNHTLNALEDLLEALSCAELRAERPAIAELSKRLGDAPPKNLDKA